MAGRKTKYTPERVEMILKAIVSGLTNKDAALVAGIDRGTIDDWLEKYPAFSAQIARAQAERAQAWLDEIAGLARTAEPATRLRSLESLLDRCAPDYRKTERHEFTGKDGGPIAITGIAVPLPVAEDET